MEENIPKALYAPIRQFKGYIAIERGLSENTSDAYESDLEDFVKYLSESGFTSYAEIEREELRICLWVVI